MILEDYVPCRFSYSDEELLELANNIATNYVGGDIEKCIDTKSHRIYEVLGDTYFCFAITNDYQYEIIIDHNKIEVGDVCDVKV